jgi:hypothetical protein
LAIALKLIELKTSHRLPEIDILRPAVILAIFYLALADLGECTRRRPAGPQRGC